MDDLSGQTFKGYQLLERIGAGDYGAVYRALQPAMGREVAIKIILPPISSRPEFIRRFEVEAQLVARLEHLHIVPLYDFWRDPNGAYLVMRWLRAGSLAQALKKGPLDLPAAVLLVDQIASALAAAHDNRIVHGNLKPSNILLDQEGNAFLSDFGIGHDPSARQKGARPQEALADSREGLPPELAPGQESTPKTDLYSLGVTLFETITGRHPFPDLSPVERLYEQIDEPLPLIETVDDEFREGINEVIQMATAKDPAERFSHVLEMADAFRATAKAGAGERRQALDEALTRREREILAHIVEGETNKQIASALFIELPTVKWHIGNLYRKMGVRSRMQAIGRARELQLVPASAADAGSEPTLAGTLSVSLARPVNPYKGLRPFDAADSRDFFGREAFVEQLLGRLGETGEMSRFLAVLGPSGSGKSSLLSAGLVPAVWDGKLPGSERWFVVEMTPGTRPLDELEVALTRIAAEQGGNLYKHLNRDADGLLRAAGLILPKDDSELFLVVDQFEEIFILTEAEATRDQFLALLYRATTDPRSRVRVVIAMRADFYDRPLYHPSFGELLRSRMETVLPLSAKELERAIVQPAAQVNMTFEPGLPARIIEDILYQPGALPLLQYALTELFEEREGRTLTHNKYDAIGGAVGALARRAEEVYLGFGNAAREAARQMFLRTVNLGSGLRDGKHAPDTRRRITRAELLVLVDDEEVMDEVIDTFVAFRLLTLDHDRESRQPTVELAHESLISEWRRLEAWLAESREDLHQHRRLQALADEWVKSGRDPGFLLREARLDHFAAWEEDGNLMLTPDEQAYLTASLQARASRQEEDEERHKRELETARKLTAAERLRAEEQGRANRLLRALALGLAVLLVAAIGTAFFARAESNRAEAQARLAFARELAAEAVGNLAADPELSIHLALQAVRITHERDGFVLPAAEEALHRAIQTSRIHLTLPQSGGVAFSPDGSFLVAGSDDGSVHVWNANSGELVKTLKRHQAAVTSVAFSPDGSRLATASADYHRIVWGFDSGRPLLELSAAEETAPRPGLSKVVFDPDGELLLSTTQSEEAGIWEVKTGRQIIHFDDSAGPAAAFSPDGRRVALMTASWDIVAALEEGAGSEEDPATILWQERLFDYADPFIEFVGPSSEIESTFREPGSVSYSPDDGQLLTTVVSSIAVMRDSETGEALFMLNGHTNIINGTAYGPDGEMVATAGADGTARVWDAATGQVLLVLEGHGNEVIDLAFSPDGRRLATSSLDGTTKVWDISPGSRGEWPIPIEHQGPAVVAFAPDSPRLASVGQDGVANIVDVTTGIRKTSSRDVPHAGASETNGSSLAPIAIPAFSHDGALLALGGERGVIHLFDAVTGERLRSFQLGSAVSALAFDPNENRLFAGDADGILSVLDLVTGELLGEWTLMNGFVNGLVLSGDGATLAIAGAAGSANVVRLDEILPKHLPAEPAASARWLPDSSILTSLIGHNNVISSIERSPDDAQYLTASWDGTVRVWDAATGNQLLLLAGHQGRVWHAALDSDGQRIVSAGADGAINMWSARDGERLFVLGHQPDAILSLAVSSGGKFLAASDAGGAVRIYVLPIDDLLALARSRLTRDMSDEECRRYLHTDRCPG